MGLGTLVGGNSVYGNGTTTATSGANTIIHYYDRAGIKAANESNIYGQFSDSKMMPRKMGKTFKISKWTHMYDLDIDNVDFATKGYLGKRDLATVSTNLANSGGTGTIAEGAGAVNKVTPKKITVSADIARYGFMVPYTDEVEMFSEDAIQVRYREELGRLANRAYEDLTQRDMLQTTTVINASSVANVSDLGATVTLDDTNADAWKISFDLIRKGAKLLVRNRAERNTSIVTGSNKIDTKTVNKAFYAIIGAEVKFDLETATRGSSYEKEYVYVPAYKYAGASNLAEGEVGQMHDVRFIESESAMIEMAAGSVVPQNYAGTLSASGGTDNTSATAGDRDNFDVFPVLFPTKGAFATVGLKGTGKMKFLSKSPEQVELGNPYGTQGFFSVNFWYAGLILQPEKLLRINVLATA
jgi:N4-gp56 family major capsid protein